MMPEQEIFRAARMAHVAVRNWCRENGDFSLPRWHEAIPEYHESTLDSVRFILTYPDSPPEALHQRWMEQKLTAGWVYGPMKSVALRVHPDLVPFTELSWEAQVKDRLFIATVRALER